ncbi:hypothetical protein SJ260_16730, partial [Citrobacter portucalensis]|uniref:hypothetical protein n=1 Tax=Citrobacter portucalensis TaxID=1639133 RepID=UPI0029DA3B83
KSSLRELFVLCRLPVGSGPSLHPCRPSPLPASLRADPVSRQHLIDFQPDQGVASALWLSAISVLLFTGIQVKAQVVRCGLVRLKIADAFP